MFRFPQYWADTSIQSSGRPAVRICALVVSVCIVSACGRLDSVDTTLGAASKQSDLHELATFPTPAGIEENRFRILKQALAENIRTTHDGSFISRLPIDDIGQIEGFFADTAYPGNEEFRWSCKISGDLDSNAEVNIGDIVPIGRHFAKGKNAPDWFTNARFADADGNGEVGISDITVLGNNYLCTIDSFVLQSSATPDIESSWNNLATIPVGQGFKVPDDRGLVFALEIPEPYVFSGYRLIPGLNGEVGTPSNSVILNEGARFSLDISTGTSGDTALVCVQYITDYFHTDITENYQYYWEIGDAGVCENPFGSCVSVLLGPPGLYEITVFVDGLPEMGPTAFPFDFTVQPAQ
jgi:hypothetical protein